MLSAPLKDLLEEISLLTDKMTDIKFLSMIVMILFIVSDFHRLSFQNFLTKLYSIFLPSSMVRIIKNTQVLCIILVVYFHFSDSCNSNMLLSLL